MPGGVGAAAINHDQTHSSPQQWHSSFRLGTGQQMPTPQATPQGLG
ncbi:hypothetical protein CKAH01_00267 [Colletotrichum kahawae]|uniref:Uncharacterized protein n=1 Tax=Colletotrichum kahawae TaxID=34407 RepID=A0AAD9YY41_COLKA|nr:hypothetical protein CKAH01_00267 [Colletotrichum kahawae]